MQPLGGPGMGMHFLPRVGHEVLVDFFDNDVDRPYVLASLYNGRGEGGMGYHHMGVFLEQGIGLKQDRAAALTV